MLSLMSTMSWVHQAQRWQLVKGGDCPSLFCSGVGTSSPMWSFECHNINRTSQGGPQGWQGYGREALWGAGEFTWFVQPGGDWGRTSHCGIQHPQEGQWGGRQTLIPLATSDRSRGNGMELCQDRFTSGTRKGLFTLRVVGHSNRLRRAVRARVEEAFSGTRCDSWGVLRTRAGLDDVRGCLPAGGYPLVSASSPSPFSRSAPAAPQRPYEERGRERREAPAPCRPRLLGHRAPPLQSGRPGGAAPAPPAAGRCWAGLAGRGGGPGPGRRRCPPQPSDAGAAEPRDRLTGAGPGRWEGRWARPRRGGEAAGGEAGNTGAGGPAQGAAAQAGGLCGLPGPALPWPLGAGGGLCSGSSAPGLGTAPCFTEHPGCGVTPAREAAAGPGAAGGGVGLGTGMHWSAGLLLFCFSRAAGIVQTPLVTQEPLQTAQEALASFSVLWGTWSGISLPSVSSAQQCVGFWARRTSTVIFPGTRSCLTRLRLVIGERPGRWWRSCIGSTLSALLWGRIQCT